MLVVLVGLEGQQPDKVVGDSCQGAGSQGGGGKKGGNARGDAIAQERRRHAGRSKGARRDCEHDPQDAEVSVRLRSTKGTCQNEPWRTQLALQGTKDCEASLCSVQVSCHAADTALTKGAEDILGVCNVHAAWCAC